MSLASFFIVSVEKGHNPPKAHSHAYWEVVYNDSSGGIIEYCGTRQQYQRGTFHVLPPNDPHRQTCDGKGLHWCVEISGSEVDGLKAGVYRDNGKVKELFRSISDEIENKRPLYRAVIEAETARLILEIKRIAEKEKAPSKEDERVSSVKRLLDDNYDKKIKLSDLSDNIIISKEYLRDAFKKQYGVTPIQYVIRKRMEKAKQLLSTGDIQVKVVAEACGFEDEYYFSRLFKRVTGKAPKSFRAEK